MGSQRPPDRGTTPRRTALAGPPAEALELLVDQWEREE